MKQFDQDQIVIGREGEVHLDLSGDGVSPIHCMVELRDGGHYVCDLGSQSGTFKNGQAVLDEALSSGDEIGVGPFKLSFFVGVPKAKGVPGATVITTPPSVPAAEMVATPVEETVTQAPPAIPSLPPEPPATFNPPPVEEAREEVKVAPVIPVEAPRVEERPVTPAAPAAKSRPEIKVGKSESKKKKSSKTFAPASEIKDLKSYLKPGNGPVVEVIVAWKERILTTYHFKGNKNIRVNTGDENSIALPDGLLPKGYSLMDLGGGLRVNTTSDMAVEMVSSVGIQSVDDLARNGKAVKAGTGYNVRVDQAEMVCVTLPQGNMTLYIRFGPAAPVVPVIPLMLSSSEMTGVVASIIIVALLALYISATIPKDWDQNKQEEVQRIAQVIFNKPPEPKKPTPPPPEPEPPKPTPPPVAATPPPPPPKKVVVSDQTKDAQKKGQKPQPSQKAETAARAAEVAPKPNAKDRTKKFTSTRQGGAIKTGQTAGANAQSSNKDLSKVGLFSAFGGGGSRKNIDKAYTGAGEVLGMADKATGTSGFNEDRAGDDLGSKFKDSGAGGKGTATQGIAGVGTKGRGSGQSAYGASDGYGSKNSVAIEGGGFEESFDGTIDKEAIRRVIRAKKFELQSCYERALNTLEKGRKLEGKIVLSWEIIERGQARNVKIKSSTLGNRQVENCIRDRLASWTFPEPPPGLVAEVQAYPFVLNQSN
ncbi:AgmX/PglI C-terminal domain-containing protein [Bdellovibrio sp. HCB2-146]|uniref:AgmX/PglI C-terminal domain-containing protein n=1 Tax=Bdellovibrio sp. HCB2-146 TaxID=3394362 RepID=UPI0039BC8E10